MENNNHVQAKTEWMMWGIAAFFIVARLAMFLLPDNFMA
jgi:hypothetical protein